MQLSELNARRITRRLVRADRFKPHQHMCQGTTAFPIRCGSKAFCKQFMGFEMARGNADRFFKPASGASKVIEFPECGSPHADQQINPFALRIGITATALAHARKADGTDAQEILPQPEPRLKVHQECGPFVKTFRFRCFGECLFNGVQSVPGKAKRHVHRCDPMEDTGPWFPGGCALGAFEEFRNEPLALFRIGGRFFKQSQCVFVIRFTCKYRENTAQCGRGVVSQDESLRSKRLGIAPGC